MTHERGREIEHTISKYWHRTKDACHVRYVLKQKTEIKLIYKQKIRTINLDNKWFLHIMNCSRRCWQSIRWSRTRNDKTRQEKKLNFIRTNLILFLTLRQQCRAHKRQKREVKSETRGLRNRIITDKKHGFRNFMCVTLSFLTCFMPHIFICWYRTATIRTTCMKSRCRFVE